MNKEQKEYLEKCRRHDKEDKERSVRCRKNPPPLELKLFDNYLMLYGFMEDNIYHGYNKPDMGVKHFVLNNYRMEKSQALRLANFLINYFKNENNE